MRRLKKILIGMVLLITFLALTGFFVVPPVLKSLLTKNLAVNLHRNVSLETIQFNAFALCLSAKLALVLSDVIIKVS